MAGDQQRNRDIARGLAKAALHRVTESKTSALGLMDDALELHPDSFVLAADCRISHRLFEPKRLWLAAERARARAREWPELQPILRQLDAGALRTIALTHRFADRLSPQVEPVAGRVAYVLHSSLPHSSNGYAMRSHGMAKALIEKGVDLVCLTKPGFPYDLDRYQQSLDSLAMAETVDGVVYNRIAWPLQRRFTRRDWDETAHAPIQYLEQAVDALVDRFTQLRPACVVAASNFVTALPACLAARQLGLPFIYEVRGFWEMTRASRDSSYLASMRGRQEVFLESELARAADAVITLTGPMREELQARGVEPSRITLIRNACHADTFRPLPRNEVLARRIQLPADVPVIGYIGSFTQYEGLDDLIEACGMLKLQGSEFRLLLMGGEPADETGGFPVTARNQQIARQAGLQDWLIMPGRVPHDEVAQWYSLIDIAPFARKPQMVTELVSPLKPLEALAMEKAIVVSSVGGMSEMVRDGETGLVFDKGDVASLAQALQRLLRDRGLRVRLGKAGGAWVRLERSWEKAAETMMAVVSSLTQ